MCSELRRIIKRPDVSEAAKLEKQPEKSGKQPLGTV